MEERVPFINKTGFKIEDGEAVYFSNEKDAVVQVGKCRGIDASGLKVGELIFTDPNTPGGWIPQSKLDEGTMAMINDKVHVYIRGKFRKLRWYHKWFIKK